MPLSDQEREEIAAVRDSDGRGLPVQAIIASQRYLAEKLLASDDELRALDAEFEALDTSIPMLAEAVMVYRRIKQGLLSAPTVRDNLEVSHGASPRPLGDPATAPVNVRPHRPGGAP